MDNQDATFSKVREALEIADRVEKLRKYVNGRRKDLIHEIGAVRAVDVERNELQNYFHYEQINDILWHIVRPGNEWKVEQCCGNIMTELRQ